MPLSSVAEANPIVDWDDAYANADHIPAATQFLSHWPRAAADFRRQLVADGRCQLDTPYGNHPRACFDIFLPTGESRGLVLFVHGGYWLRFCRQDWSHLATGVVQRGYTAVLPSYPLCPEVSIAEISEYTAQALIQAASSIVGPIHLAGHSAGGHLVTRLLCVDSKLPDSVLSRIQKTVSISGVHDLVPLLNTAMNKQFRLDQNSALVASPARQIPLAGIDVCAWVGADERPEFLRQSELLVSLWNSCGARAVAHVEPGRHHFNVIEDLLNPNSTMLDWLLTDSK
ncbi:MAG: alpha/beta hydrolase [Granulosicoccus sp.]